MGFEIPFEPDLNGDRPPLNEDEGVTIDWLDGFKTAYRTAYPEGYEEGFAAGHNTGFEEAAHRFRVLLENNYDTELKEAFENLIG